jgi:LemA protein
VIAIALWVALGFNRLVRLRNQVRAAWADIDVQLTRRHDLVPQLVAAVRGYADHERATMEAVTALRAEAVSTSSPARLGEVETALEAGLGRLFALRESYPDLMASENFGALQGELVEVEDQLHFSRRFYNGAVRDLNTTRERFPDTLIARLFGFREAEYFQAGTEARVAPRTELS